MDDLEKKIYELVKENNAIISFAFDFPQYKILPDDVNLALKVLQNHGMHIKIMLVPVEKSGEELALE
jgi:hypothetical protein